MATKKQPAKKTAAKKQTAKKTAAKKPAKKQTAKKAAPKKPAGETTKKMKTTQDTSATIVDAVVEAVITTPEIQEKIVFVEDKIEEAKDIAEEVSSLIRMNDVKTARIRKKMLAWFRKK
jgi:3-hydroxyacyl-CoA dehydrogenase